MATGPAVYLSCTSDLPALVNGLHGRVGLPAYLAVCGAPKRGVGCWPASMVAAVVLGCLPVSSASSRLSPRGRRRPLIVSAIRDTRSVGDQNRNYPERSGIVPTRP